MVPATDSVPDPDSGTLLNIGFGLTGGAMRRRPLAATPAG
jgi:hypothetical protein